MIGHICTVIFKLNENVRVVLIVIDEFGYSLMKWAVIAQFVKDSFDAACLL